MTAQWLFASIYGGVSHYDTCYGQRATGTVINWLRTVSLGQIHYVTCYAQCDTGTESLCNLLWTKSHRDKVIMTLVMDKVPLGQGHYDTCYGQCLMEQSHCDTCYSVLIGQSLWHLLRAMCQ